MTTDYGKFCTGDEGCTMHNLHCSYPNCIYGRTQKKLKIVNPMIFNSKVKVVEHLDQFDSEMVKNEPMFFSADLDFAYDNGGPITKNFIQRLPKEFFGDKYAYLDSRVHMLMEGWYPCIPGWHHDDVPRNTPDGQPNYVNPPYRTKHVMALVNADIAPTQFLIGNIQVPTPVSGSAIYKQWDDSIDSQLNKYNDYVVMNAESNKLYEFDCDTFHRGTAAVKNGWRWFGRVSIGRKRTVPSEIRRQVQVYMPTINAGW